MNGINIAKYNDFKPWVQKVMPGIYDDTFSYYELLSKVVGYLNQMNDQQNEIIDWLNEMTDWQNKNIGMLREQFIELRDGLTLQQQEFERKLLKDNEDFKNEILDKLLGAQVGEILQEWFDNGKLSEIINNEVFEMKADKTYVDEKLTHYNEVVKPEHFGAKGDGATDDYKALSSAINKAMRDNLPLYLSYGKTYLVNSKPEADIHLFRVTSPLWIFGRGKIKIGKIGNYECVFNLNSGANNCKFEDFTLDDNSKENTKNEDTGNDGKRRIPFYAWNAGVKVKDITFNNVKILDSIGVWQITLNADNVNITNCTITYGSTGEKPLYDRTSIYMGGENWLFQNNKLIGSPFAHTGLETHGSNINVVNNLVKNYDSPLLIVNDGAGSNYIDSVAISGNTFKSRQGIKIWFEVNETNVGHVVFNNNIVEVSERLPAISTYDVAGTNVTVESVVISGNTFKQTVPTEAFFQIKNTRSGGAQIGVTYKSFVIEGNTFAGTCTHAIKLEVQPSKAQIVKNLSIRGNDFLIDKLNSDRLIQMLDVPYAFENVLVEGNKFTVDGIIDTSSIVRILNGNTANRTIGYGNFKLYNNEYKIPDGIKLELSSSEANIFLMVKEKFNVDVNGFTQPVAYGGVIEDILGQRISFDKGIGKNRILYGTNKPSVGSFFRGDILWNKESTNGGYVGWVCIGTGSGGATWKPFGMIEE